jgi:2-desacetyl-2-hydroxyethyl bacteriochlorophyllide A dehydrogenase
MKAAVLEAYHQPLAIREVEVPPPGPEEVTLEVRACGLCMTDIHLQEGRIPTVRLPLTPGHEFAGVVVALGDNTSGVALGDRVVTCVDVGCRRCDFCLRGETTRCVSLTRLGFERAGGMAERVNVPAANLERLADGIPFEKAAIIPDAVVSMFRGLRTAGGVGAGSVVAILGTGGLGMQGVKIAKLLGAHVTCTDRIDAKLERARALGADCVINTDRDEFVATARARVGPFDVVVDTIGQGRSLLDAVRACRNGGRVVALGYVDPTLEIPSYEITIKEKQVVGSRAASRSEFRDVVRLVNAGRLDPDVGERIPAARVNQALDDLKHGRFLTRSVLILPF